jgi:hypothetical protein
MMPTSTTLATDPNVGAAASMHSPQVLDQNMPSISLPGATLAFWEAFPRMWVPP